MPPGTQAGVCAAADSGCRNIETAPTDMPRNARLPKTVINAPKYEKYKMLSRRRQ